LVKKLGDVTASNGSLKSFEKRHQIVCNEVSSESGDFSAETVSNLVVHLPSIMEGYEQKDIANGNETGLFTVRSENLTPLLASINNVYTRNVIKTVPLFSTR
jgi:hypothetical protein